MSLIGRTKVKEKLIGNTHLIDKIDGYSAYEIAVKHGFKGSEEEWLKSIKGEKGDKGDAAPFEATSLYGTDTDIDRLIEPGFYYGKNVTNSPFTNLYLEVGYGPLEYLGGPSGTELATDKYYYQKAIDLVYGTRAFRCRRGNPGSFQGVEWEYENPDPFWLASDNGYGQVFKTTEKFNGQPVYTSIVNISGFEDGKEVNITNDMGAEGSYGFVIRYSGLLCNKTASKTLPYIDGTYDNATSAWLSFHTLGSGSGKSISMKMHGGNAKISSEVKNGWVQVWFVKQVGVVH